MQRDKHGIVIGYIMDSGIFEFVLIIVIEDDAVLIYEAHNRGDPSWAA